MPLRKPSTLTSTRRIVVGGVSVPANTVLREDQIRQIKHLDAYLSNGWLKPNVDPYFRKQTVKPTVTSLNPEMVLSLIESAAGEPAAPTDLVATPGDAEVSIAFTASVADGTVVTGYQYKLGAGNWTNGTSSPLALTGLVNGQEYTVLLRAKSAAGPSLASRPVVFTPVAPAPGP